MKVLGIKQTQIIMLDDKYLYPLIPVILLGFHLFFH